MNLLPVLTNKLFFFIAEHHIPGTKPEQTCFEGVIFYQPHSFAIVPKKLDHLMYAEPLSSYESCPFLKKVYRL